jgi:hypothetical protein
LDNKDGSAAGQSNWILKERREEKSAYARNSQNVVPKKRAASGPPPAFAAAPNRPFFQDNLLNIESFGISRKSFNKKAS